MMSNKEKTYIITFFLGLILVSYQACVKQQGGNKDKYKDKLLNSTQTNNNTFNQTCLEDGRYDACIFYKNPVAQQGRPLSEKITDQTDLTKYQSYGINLRGLDRSGFLQNESIEVHSTLGPRLKIKDFGHSRIPYNESPTAARQLMTYYWANHAIQESLSRTGLFYAANEAIKFYIEEEAFGFSPETNAIYLKQNAQGNAASLNAGLIIHLLGEANLFYATNGESHNLDSDTNHRDCGPTANQTFEKDCCVNAMGCSKALISGTSDYLVAMLFPNHPTIGETYHNDMSGLNFCGISRDLREFTYASFQQAYDVCADKNMPGQSFIMGSVYASTWFEIRRLAKDLDTNRGHGDIDRLYMLHLAELNGSDNFESAFEKVLEIEEREFNGYYRSLILRELSRRGMTSFL